MVETILLPCIKFLTNEGEKNIEDIEVGDMVLVKAENDPKEETVYKTDS